jgi:hypothetical protein
VKDPPRNPAAAVAIAGKRYRRTRAVAPNDQAVPVMLDFMRALGAGRRLGGKTGLQGSTNPGGRTRRFNIGRT